MPPARPRVLLVDGEPAVRRVMARVLAARGCDVHPVATGEAAVVAVLHQRFDVVVSDVTLVGPLNGEALWRTAVGVRPELKNRFVFLTDYVLPLVPGLRLVTKPFDGLTLWKAVSSVLEGQAESHR